MTFKKSLFILLLLLTSGLLSACSGSGFAPTSWPGITASEDRVYVASGNHVYSLQAAGGALIWRYPAAAERGVSFFASPALTSDGQVIAGSYNNKLYSLDAQSGASNWVFEEATNHYIAGPVVTENSIFAPNSDGNLYAVDLAGKALWPAPYQTSQALWAAPTVNATTLYLPGLNHQLFAIQAATGKDVWMPLDLDGAMVGTPALSEDGILYVGTFENDLRALRAGTGEAVWQAPFKTKDWVWSGPALEGNTLYFGDLSGTLYAVDRETGQARWQYETGSPIVGTPLFFDDTLYIGNEAGILFAFNPDGSLKWSKTIGGKIYSNPVLAAGNIIVGMVESENLLTAVDPDGDIQWSFIPPK